MIQISEKSINKLMEIVKKGNEVHLRYTENETEIEVMPWKPFEYNIMATDNHSEILNGWIPCSERLPEDGEEVFVYLFDNPSPYIAWVEDDHWYTEEFEVDREYEPPAWMALPEPYRKDGEQYG